MGDLGCGGGRSGVAPPVLPTANPSLLEVGRLRGEAPCLALLEVVARAEVRQGTAGRIVS